MLPKGYVLQERAQARVSTKKKIASKKSMSCERFTG